jgi:hypothetical protein
MSCSIFPRRAPLMSPPHGLSIEQRHFKVFLK